MAAPAHLCDDGRVARTALILIDLQKAIDDPSWGRRNNPALEENVARLLSTWRAARQPVVHVRHHSTSPKSTYRPGQPGVEFKDEANPIPGEPVFTKSAHSAFVGTDLQAFLHGEGLRRVVICGVITDNSVEATVRHAGDLGFEVVVAADACATFDRRDRRGHLWLAEDVHALSLAQMDGEYATVEDTESVLGALGSVR